VQTLHRLRAERRRAQELHVEEMATIVRQVERLRTDLEGAERRRADQEQALSVLAHRKATLTARLAGEHEALTAIARDCADTARVFAGWIEAGIPYTSEAHADGFRQVVARLDREPGSSEEAVSDLADAVTGFLESAAEHVVDGGRVEVWNGPVEFDGG